MNLMSIESHAVSPALFARVDKRDPEALFARVDKRDRRYGTNMYSGTTLTLNSYLRSR
jgi:hypothetical protein